MPVPAAVASPRLPAELLMEATEGSETVQAACCVRSCFVASEKMPVAVNCRVVPSGASALTGVTWMATRVASVTVSVPLPATPPATAPTVAVPRALDLA